MKPEIFYSSTTHCRIKSIQKYPRIFSFIQRIRKDIIAKFGRYSMPFLQNPYCHFIKGNVSMQWFFCSEIVIVLLLKSICDHFRSSISLWRRPVLIAKMMISCNHFGEALRSRSSSSNESHLSIVLFTFSFLTFLTGLSLANSHSQVAMLKAWLITVSS